MQLFNEPWKNFGIHHIEVSLTVREKIVALQSVETKRRKQQQ